MQKLLFLMFFLIVSSVSLSAQVVQKGNVASVTFSKLPPDGVAFAEITSKYNNSPQGAAALFVMAMMAYSPKPINALQCLAQCVWPGLLVQGDLGYEGKQLKDAHIQQFRTQLGGIPHLPKAYIKGTSPDNLYLLPKQNFIVEVQTTAMSGDPASGTMKLFVRCTGAAVPRPLTVKKAEDGKWYVAEWSAMLTEVMPPRTSKDMSKDSDY